MNSLFASFGGVQNQFARFMREMKGKNPNELINELLRSGKISQQQLDLVQKQASELQSLFRK